MLLNVGYFVLACLKLVAFCFGCEFWYDYVMVMDEFNIMLDHVANKDTGNYFGGVI